MHILGLDIGAARIGVAMGNDETRLASPWGTLEAHPEERCFAKLQTLIEQEGIERLVIGLPHLLQKREQATEQQKTICAWVERFSSPLEVVFEDETLSTVLAQRWQREQGGRGKRDDLAAYAILQSYLDRRG